MLFLWLQIQKIVTGLSMSQSPVDKATSAMVHEPMYWVAIGMVGVALTYLSLQMLFPSLFTVGRTVAAAALPVVATLLEKTLFVLEGLMYPVFNLYHGVPGKYSPSWIEISSVIGAFSLVLLFFLVVSRLIPLVEVEAHD
jgi:Ni/Fe-hydrogenase subunit HybB-like protein